MEKNLGVLTACAFEGAEVRVLGTPVEPWFVAADVLTALDIHEKNVSRVIKRLDDDEKLVVKLTTNSAGNPDVWTISEPGLYKVMLRARTPKAEKFTRWVTHEVLPSIRKKGYYALPTVQEHIDALINQTEMYHYEVAEKIMGVKINSMADWNRAKKLEQEAAHAEMEKERGYKHTFGSYFGKYHCAAESAFRYNLSKEDREQHTSVIGGRTFMDDYLVGEIEKVLEKQGFDKSVWIR